MSFIGILLFPLTLIYSLAVRVRNHLYDIEYSKSTSFEVPVILVGNLSVGGTGKTPMVEYLVRLLHEKTPVAVLSRGYKRETSGFRIASNEDSPESIGDEPFQIFNRFKPHIKMAVGENRLTAIPEILFNATDVKAIIMDDGFQHRAVNPKFKILLTDFGNPFFEDFLLPSGRLREPRTSVKRADCVIVTKCPDDLSNKDKEKFTLSVLRYSKRELPVYFSAVGYQKPIPLNGQLTPVFDRVLLVSGLANNNSFSIYCSENWLVEDHIIFPDHHKYSKEDVASIKDRWAKSKHPNLAILTTEKDAVKLSSFSWDGGVPIFFLPIQTHILENGSEFDTMIRQQIPV